MIRRAVLATTLVLACAAGPLQAEAPAPAIPSIKAHKSLLLDIASAGKRLVAVGERGHVVVSDDAGKTWRQVSVPVRSLLTAVFFADEQRGWAVGHDSVVLGTADGGNTWALQHYKEYNPDAPLADDAAALSEDEMALDEYSDDMAADEGRGAVSREGVPLLDVWFANATSGIAVGAYGLMLRTADGGKSWQDVSNDVSNPEGWHFNAITGSRTEGNVVVIAGEKGTLYRSQDGGASFAAAVSPYAGSFFGATAASDGALYVYGLQGSLFRSMDKGVQWSRIETGVSSGLNDACELSAGQILIAGNAGVVLSGNAVSTAFTKEDRADRQSVLSCARAGNGVVLVGEGGAKLAATGKLNH